MAIYLWRYFPTCDGTIKEDLKLSTSLTPVLLPKSTEFRHMKRRDCRLKKGLSFPRLQKKPERLQHGDEYRFWQTGGGYDRNLVGKELLEKIVYVHANPIRWKLAERPCDYRWSSAAAYDGLSCIGPSVDFALLPPVDVDLTRGF